MIYSILIRRIYLKPDVFIKCNDRQLAKFITGIYSPYATFSFIDIYLPVDKKYLKITVKKIENDIYIITYTGKQIESHKDNAAQILENIIYDTTYPIESVLPLHGAAVMKSGYIFMLLGFTSSGKSTLCSYLLTQEFEYITEDLIFISRDSFNVLPYRKCISLRPGGYNILNSIHGIEINDIQHLKWGDIERYVFTPTYNNCLVQATEITGSIINIFIERTESENSIVRQMMPNSFIELTKSRYTGSKATVEDTRLLCDFLKKSTCYKIKYSNMEYVKDRLLDICTGRDFPAI